MTESDATEAIADWVRVCLYGVPDEHDAGSEAPREYGMASPERGYRAKSRDHWSTVQELIDERRRQDPDKLRGTHERVEACYKAMGSDRWYVTNYYFGARQVPLGRAMRDAVDKFREMVRTHESITQNR